MIGLFQPTSNGRVHNHTPGGKEREFLLAESLRDLRNAGLTRNADSCGAGTGDSGGFGKGNTCAKRKHTPGGHEHDQRKHGRSGRAKATHKPVTRERRLTATNNEQRLVKAIGGKQTDGNAPMDVLVNIEGVTHGIEVKTMLDNTNDKITIHPSSRRRKQEWASKGKQIHTVIFDNRNTYDGGKHRSKYSGHGLYYRRGVGSFRVGSMVAVEGYDHLMDLMAGEVDE